MEESDEAASGAASGLPTGKRQHKPVNMSVRRLGNFRLPVTHVRLAFTGYSDAERDAALALFWQTYQKGGG